MKNKESVVKTEDEKKKENKELLEGFLNIVAGIVIAKLIIVFLFAFARVNGESMTNNFYNNSWYVIYNITWNFFRFTC